MALKRRGDSAIFPALRRVFSRACGVLIDGERAGTERYSTGDSQPHGYGSLSRRTADEARKTARATYRGVAQPGLARLLGVQEVVGSNPATPTFLSLSWIVSCDHLPNRQCSVERAWLPRFYPLGVALPCLPETNRRICFTSDWGKRLGRDRSRIGDVPGRRV